MLIKAEANASIKISLMCGDKRSNLFLTIGLKNYPFRVSPSLQHHDFFPLFVMLFQCYKMVQIIDSWKHSRVSFFQITLICGLGVFKSKHSSNLLFQCLFHFQGHCLFLVCIKPCLIASKDALCSQGNQGELHITAAQTGVEQRVPQAAKGWVRAPYYSLSLSAAVFWICYNTMQPFNLSPIEPRQDSAWKNRG